MKWQQADASALPFGDAVFDAVVCQFGVMFFPDKGKAFAEARRVLKPRGRFLFNVWDRIEENEFADTVMVALATVFPHDPPMFMERTPHGYHDIAEMELRRAGFANTMVDTVVKESIAPSPREPAIGFCQGTPMRNEIEARDPTRLAEATDVAEAALASRFGAGAVTASTKAHVITAYRRTITHWGPMSGAIRKLDEEIKEREGREEPTDAYQEVMSDDDVSQMFSTLRNSSPSQGAGTVRGGAILGYGVAA